MRNLFFLLGLIVGWLLASVVPPPNWLAHRVEGIVETGRDKIEEKVQEQKEAINEKLRGQVEEGAIDLQKTLQKQ
ncbi:MAG: hypothetical protein HYT79_01090 [Elusimicrobia bacterium]|nr:hypothetical protein [Elusimicrobiota bacterium]